MASLLMRWACACFHFCRFLVPILFQWKDRADDCPHDDQSTGTRGSKPYNPCCCPCSPFVSSAFHVSQHTLLLSRNQWKEEIEEKTNDVFKVHIHHGKDKLKKLSTMRDKDVSYFNKPSDQVSYVPADHHHELRYCLFGIPSWQGCEGRR